MKITNKGVLTLEFTPEIKIPSGFLKFNKD